MSRVVVSVIGQDRTGIVAGISKVLAENNVNILDISQTIMDNLFAMIMLVDISNAKVDFATLKNELEKAGKGLGVQVIVQHEDIFKYMHRI
ncbi:ACT domain-containing protein [Methanocaldococcus sp. FS406-22]|uniref:ACT domain-containing protein n=1 Tax=Methanocaldococcus sp. (strain FS406-22) TaxID=644281 RepID=UPI0001BF576D|nr:ACT domain-containing protein [Methanocaldococcus sp. FS406-22]ADC69416.1 ACT domain-containing protein [Methanocaldococcus sp. FS406-22]